MKAGAEALDGGGGAMSLAAAGPALAAAGVGLWCIDMKTGLAVWDAVSSRILGQGDEPQVVPAPLPVHPADLPEIRRRLARNLRGLGDTHVDVRIVTPRGAVRWVRSTARPSAGVAEAGRWLTGIISDITQHKEAEIALQASQRQLATLVDNLQGIVYQCTLGPWRLSFVSDGVLALTGYCREEVLAPGFTWDDLVHPDDLARLRDSVASAIETGDAFAVVYRLRTRQGQERWVLERGRAVYDSFGAPVSLEGFVGDISEQKQAEQRASWIATHDSLTLLPNRLLLQERLEQLIRGGGGRGFALILIDVDEFKRVNDSLGHDAGDALLCTFATRLGRAIGAHNMVARLGGDEFACIVQDVAGEEGARAACEAIVAQLTEPCQYDDHLIDCRASLGVSLFPAHGGSRTELLKHADLALYAAKNAGKGVYKIFESPMRAEMQKHVSMLSLGRDALRRRDIVPYYQPKLDLRTGALVGFEALLRWRHPQLGLQLPDAISACFEDPLLGARLSEEMARQVIEDMRRWRAEGVNFGHVALNAATADFRRGDYSDRLLERLAAAGIPPALLQVEVTESVFLGRGAGTVERALNTLSDAGVKIALDDFGTGYASLSHLKQFPVDLLKIDRSFIHDLERDENAAVIVRAVINMARSLGLTSVAEGVETHEQAARLLIDGCDQAQGFLYSRGISGETVAGFVEAMNGAAVRAA